MTAGNYHTVYMLGIGGIGMSAMARWFSMLGTRVMGYDKTETALTQTLAEEGMAIHYTDDPALIPEEVRADPARVLVIYTPAIPADHRELRYFLSAGFEVFKRSEVLGVITRDYRTVAVAGSHGKTTTSSIIAHMLKSAGVPSVSLLGGIVRGYESNLIVEGEPESAAIAVVEADEYDRSFLRLSPDLAVITSADPDHLDIYGNHHSMLASFSEFASRLKPGGVLFLREGLQQVLAIPAQADVRTYGVESGQAQARNLRSETGIMLFDFISGGFRMEGLEMLIPGRHNVENATAAIAVGLHLGLDESTIRDALRSYPGVKRRFEYIIRRDDLVFIDDYAHHPREIDALLGSVRELYPGRRITAVFQPHLYSRTRDFAPEFARSLAAADEVLLLDIYPAREEPIPGVDSGVILREMRHPAAERCVYAELPDRLLKKRPEILLTIGAGDIDRLVAPIRDILQTTDRHA
jgi:UDP-N-acetylmuramate--alanine ligase